MIDHTKKTKRKILLFVALVVVMGCCFIFWLTTHQTITNYYKYVAYIAGFAVATWKEIFKRDEQTNQLKPQPLSHWALPLVGLISVCSASVLSDFSDARLKKQDTETQKLQHRVEDVEHRLEVNELLRKLDEQKHLQIFHAQQQIVASERIRQEQKALARQNRKQQELQATQIKFFDREQESETRHEQHTDAVRSDIATATRSVQSLRKTLYGFERAVNPIQSIVLTYAVHIPLDEPEMKEYKNLLDQKLNEYKIVASLGSEPDPSSPFTAPQRITIVNNDGKPQVQHGIAIKKGSALYPNDLGPDQVFSYQIRMQIQKRVLGSLAPTVLDTTLPDLLISMKAAYSEPDLVYTFEDHQLHLWYSKLNVVNAAKLTGRIVALPDLNGARVEATRNAFYRNDGAYLAANHLTRLQAKCYIDKIEMTISGRYFDFEPGKIKHFLDPNFGDVCYFTFANTPQSIQSSFADTPGK